MEKLFYVSPITTVINVQMKSSIAQVSGSAPDVDEW